MQGGERIALIDEDSIFTKSCASPHDSQVEKRNTCDGPESVRTVIDQRYFTVDFGREPDLVAVVKRHRYSSSC
jgi:hypothetical protein